ncbi:hypothetical protein CFC21_076348 [Triticum aestivum]|uniref:Uncharacterized protein n=2 Tax=Triticum aestivum TaxID=4565 RepID=A0A9R1KYF1_WHEAT|nr:uncharacterized protein LOC123110726 isoform X3 [Triticum aestivum]KAF7070914.1 hypothetical protein CFC21_076348 [Triticum aestivum]
MDAGRRRSPASRYSPALPRVRRRSCLLRRSLLPRAAPQPPLPASRIFPLLPKKLFLLPPAASPARGHPSLLALMEEAWPALGPTACDAAFPPPPRPPWRGARRETVAKESSAQAVSRIVSSCANSSGLAVAAVDANAAISGGAVLASTAGRQVTVLEEVCDAAARRRLALLPTPVETVDLTPEFVKRVGPA